MSDEVRVSWTLIERHEVYIPRSEWEAMTSPEDELSQYEAGETLQSTERLDIDDDY